MDLNIYLSAKEKEQMLDNDFNQIKKYNNIDFDKSKYFNTIEPVVKFEVLTEGYHFLVSVRDMEQICTQISVSQLEAIGVKLNTEILFGEPYVNVNDEFLIYVQKNTKNPKYVPELVLLMTKERDFDYTSSGYDAPEIALKYACRVDGKTEVIEQIEEKTR